MSDVCFSVQQAGFLLELSSDWIVLRASENAHRFLGDYHVRMVGEPLANFTLAQPLHDLRNSLSRQQSASGIARAYHIRLTGSQNYLDIAFQQVDGRFILEGVPSSQTFGNAFGTVSRLVEGLGACDSAGVARRMRALCGTDRVLLVSAGGDLLADCSRSRFPPRETGDISELPEIIIDTKSDAVPVHPRAGDGGASATAIMRSPNPDALERLRETGVRSMLNIPVKRGGEVVEIFSCDSQSAMQPSFELHAAAELFAQFYANRR